MNDTQKNSSTATPPANFKSDGQYYWEAYAKANGLESGSPDVGKPSKDVVSEPVVSPKPAVSKPIVVAPTGSAAAKPEQASGAATEPEVSKFDLFKTYAETGLPIEKIVNSLKFSDVIVPLKSKEAYWEQYQDKFKDKETFEKAYDEVYSKYDAVQTAKFRKQILPIGSEVMGVGAKENPYFGSYNYFSLNQKSTTYDPSAVKNPYQVIETPQLNASRKGYHMVPVLDNEGVPTDEFIKVKGRLTPSMKLAENYYTAPEFDEDGKFTGEYSYKKFADGITHYDLDQASFWGDQLLYGKSILDPILGFGSTATVELVQSFAQMGDIFNDILLNAKNDSITEAKKTDPTSLWLNKVIMGTESLKFKPSVEQTQSKFIGSGIMSFLYQTGVGLGYVVPQRLIAGGVAAGVKGITKTALRSVSTGIGTSQAINGFYRSAREAGLGEMDAAYLSLLAMPAVAATESMLNSKWLTRGLGANEEAILKKYLKESVSEMSKAGIDATTPKGMTQVIKNTMKKVMKDDSFVDVLTGKRIVGPALLEGTQETSEEVWYSILESAYDKGFFADLGATGEPGKSVGDGMFGTEVFTKKTLERYWDNFIGGAIIGGMMDSMMLGQKDAHKQHIMEDMIINNKTNDLLKFVTDSFKNGKLGLDHKDVKGNDLVTDEEGNSTGETFEVPEDVSYEGAVLFSKGDVLNTMNDMTYYQTVQDILAKQQIVTASGLNNPEALHSFMGQEDLKVQAFKVFKRMDQIATEINAFTIAKGETEDKGKIKELDDKINALIEERDGVFNKKGDLVKEGLQQQWEYMTAPVNENGNSKAYVDNLKFGIMNGLFFAQDAKSFENGTAKFKPMTKDLTRYIDGEIAGLRELRQGEKKSAEISEAESDIYNPLLEELGKPNFSLKKINALLGAITRHHSIYGFDKSTMDETSKKITEMAQAFSTQVSDYWGEKGLEDYSPGEQVGSSLDISNVGKSKDEKLTLDGAERQRAQNLSDTDKMLSDLSSSYTAEGAVVREEGKLTESHDRSIFDSTLWNDRDNNQPLDELIEKYFESENIGDDNAVERMNKAEEILNFVDSMLNYTEALNDAKQKPGYEKSFSHEPDTVIEDGNVTPGHDIPASYLDDIRAKNDALRTKLESIDKKIDRDAKNIQKQEQRRRYASVMQKAYIIGEIWNHNPGSFNDKDISDKMNALKTLREQLDEVGWTADPVEIKEIEKKVMEIETWIYKKGKKNKGFHHKIFHATITDSEIGKGLDYHLIKDNQLTFLSNSDGSVTNISDLTFTELAERDGNVHKTALFMRATNYINNIMNLSSEEFNNHLNNAITSKGNKKPGVEQIDSIRLIVTAAIMPHTGGKFFIRTADTKEAKTVDFRERGDNAGIVPINAVSIDGSGGVGKTTVITSIAFDIIDDVYEKMDIQKNVLPVAPSPSLLERLVSSLSNKPKLSTTGGFEYHKFIQKLKSSTQKLSVDKGSIIVIDESSRITNKDMIEISKLAKANDLTIVFLGDSMQATPKDERGNISPIQYNQRIGIRGPRINMKFRTGISDISSVQDAIAFTIKGFQTKERINFPRTKYNKEHTKGVRYTNTSEAVEEQWKTDVVKNDQANQRIIIFETKRQADKFKATLTDELSKYKKNVRYIFRDDNTDAKSDPGTVQGLEFLHVYVAIEDKAVTAETDNFDDIVYQRRLLLTAQSRAEKFLMMPTYTDSNPNLSQVAEDEDIQDYSDTEIVSDMDTSPSEESNEDSEDINENDSVGDDTVVEEQDTVPEDLDEDSKLKRQDDSEHPLVGKKLKGHYGGGDAMVIKVQTLDGKVDYIELDDGSSYEGPVAEDDMYQDYQEREYLSPSLEESFEENNTVEATLKHDNKAPRFISSAKMYADNGIIPMMVNVAFGDVKASGGNISVGSEEFLDGFDRSKQLSGDYDLVYYKEVDLWTRNGNEYQVDTHYNVLIVMDSKGNIVGVLPAPDTDFKDPQLEREGELKQFSSRKESDYSAASLDANKKMVQFSDKKKTNNDLLNAYHQHLIELHTTGFEAAKKSGENKTVIGTYTVSSDHQLGATITMNDESIRNPNSLDEFIRIYENKGVVFAKEGKNYVIVQTVVNGRMRWHLKGSYQRTSKKKNASPINEVSIPVQSKPIGKSEHDELRAAIIGLNDIAAKNKGHEFIVALYNSMPFQTIASNISKITEVIDEKRVLKPEYAGILEYDDKGNSENLSGNLKLKRANKKGVTYKAIVSDLSTVTEALIKMSTGVKVYSWMPKTKVGDKKGSWVLSGNVIPKLETAVSEIRGPYYRGSIAIDDEYQDTDTGKKETITRKDLKKPSGLKFLYSGYNGLNSITEDSAIMRSKSEAIAYIRQVLGDAYVNEFLQFSPEMSKDGQPYWGYVHGLKMVLRTSKGRVAEQAFRHEPIHIIMTELVSPKRRAQLYDAVRSYYGNNEMSDSDADEAIARMHHNQMNFKTRYKGLKGILNRFLDLLGNLFTSLKTSGTIIDEFFEEVESGFFADQISAKTNPVRTGVRFMPDDTVSNKVKKNNLRFNEMSRQFGGNDRLNSALRMTLSMIKNNSATNNILNLGSNNPVEALKETKEDILNPELQEVLADKFKGVEPHNISKLINDPFFEGDMHNLEAYFYMYVLGQGNNIDVMLKHIAPNIDVVSEELDTEIKSGYEESAGRNPDLYIPNTVRSSLHTISYYEFDSNNNVKKVQSGTRKFVDYELLKGHLITAMIQARSFENTDLDDIWAELRRMANEYGTEDSYDNESRNTILSFIEEYARVYNGGRKLRDVMKRNMERDPKGERPLISHYMFAAHPDRLLAELKSLKGIVPKEAYDTAVNSLQTKSKMSSQLLNAVVTAMNLRSIDYLTVAVNYENGVPMYSRSVYYETSTNELKRYIKGNVDMKFMDDERTYADHVLSLVDGSQVYNVKGNNIHHIRFGDVLKYKGGKWVWNKPDDKVNIAKSMFHFLGIKVKPHVISAIFRNTNNYIKDKYNIDGDEIADYLGNMMASMRSHKQFQGENDTAKTMRDNIEKFLSTKNINIPSDAESYVISDFYPMIDVIADIQGFMSARKSANFTMTPDGNTISNKVLPSRLNDIFANAPNAAASKKIVNHVIGVIEEDDSIERMNKTPLVTVDEEGELSYNDPLFAPDQSGLRVASITYGLGIKSRHTSSNINSFTATDYAHTAINAIFHDSVFSGHQHQVLGFLMDNLGDSSQMPIFNMSFGNKNENLISIVPSKEGQKMVVNEEIINRNIDYNFNYHHKAMLVSLNKWVNFFEGESYGIKIDPNKSVESQKEKLVKTRGKSIDFLSRHPLNGKNNAELISQLERAGMIRNRDYFVEKGYVKMGNSAKMNHDIYNERNYYKWNKDPQNRTQLRDLMFHKRFEQLANDLSSEKGYIMPADVSKVSPEILKKNSTNKIVINSETEWMTYVKDYEWHPFYKAFFYGYHIANNSLSNFTIGNENQFADADAKQKYNKGLVSSGLRGVIGGYYNLPATSHVIRISKELRNYKQLASMFNLDGEHDIADGQEIVLPIYARQLSHSLGGEHSMSQYNDVMIKTFHQGMDWMGHRSDQNKMAQLVLNSDIYHKTKYGKNLVKKMLTSGPGHGVNNSVDLYEEFQDIMRTEYDFNGEMRKPDYDEGMEMLYDFIAKHDIDHKEDLIHDNYAAIVSYETANKTNTGYVNNVTLGNLSKSDVMTDVRDNNGLYFQLNLNHEANLDVSRANQLEAIIGALNDHDAANTIDSVNAALTIKARQKIKNDIDRVGGTKAYMRKLGIASTERMGRANVLSDLFANPNIDVSLPMVLPTAIQAYISKINEGINPRAVGTKMIQAPSTMNMITVQDDYGNTFLANQDEAGKYKEVKNSKESSLGHYRFVDEKGKDVTDDMINKYDGDYRGDLDKINKISRKILRLKNLAQSEDVLKKIKALEEGVFTDGGLMDKVKAFQKMIKESVDFITPSQLAMNFSYREQFNIGKNETLNEALTIDIDGKRINVRAFIKSKLSPKDYYNREKRIAAIAEHLYPMLGENVTHKGMASSNDIGNYFISLLDALVVYGTRVPTSHFSSAFYGEIEMFTHKSKNTIFISPEKNLLDGSDYDIDELSIYYKSIVMEDNIPIIRTVKLDSTDPKVLATLDEDILQNTKHDILTGVFSKAENLEAITVPISVDNLQKLVAKRKAEEPHRYMNDFSTSMFHFTSSHEGKNMVSRFANAITAYTRLARIGMISPDLAPGFFNEDATLRKEFGDVDFVTARINTVLDSLATILQASVDNSKEGILGYMYTNRASGNIISALIMSGFSDTEIHEFVNQPVVRATIMEAFDTMSAGVKTKDIITLIDEKLRGLRYKYVQSDVEIGAKERLKRAQHMLNQFIAKRNEELDVEVYYPVEADNDLLTSADLLEDTSIPNKIEKIIEDSVKIANDKRAAYLDEKIFKLAQQIAGDMETSTMLEKKERARQEEKIESLATMREMHFKGEFLRRLIRGFSLYREIPTKEIDRMSLIQDLEFNMGMSLEEYATGDAKNTVGYLERAKYLPGRITENKIFNDIQEVRSYMHNLAHTIKGDSEITPDKVKFITGGSLGMESQFLIEMNDSNFTIEAFTTSDNSNLTENGIKSYRDEDDKGYTIDPEARSEYKVQVNNIGRADYSININAMMDPIGGLKGAEDIIAEHDNHEQHLKITERIREQIRKNKTDEPIVINITGSSMFRIKTKPKTEFDRFIETEVAVSSVGDIAGIYKQLPNIDQYIKELYETERSQEVFLHKSSFIKGFEKEYLDMIKTDRMTPAKHVAFQRAIQEFVLDMYFNQLSDAEFDLNNVGNRTKLSNLKIDLSNYHDSEFFTVQFAESVSELQDNMTNNPNHPLRIDILDADGNKTGSRENQFIKAISFNNGNIYFDDTFYDDIQIYKDDFRVLGEKDPQLGQMFKYYNLLVHGFRFEQGSYREIIGDEFFEDVSEYIKVVNNGIASNKKNPIKKRFNKYFLKNALVTYDELTDVYYTESDDTSSQWSLMMSNEIYPTYYRERGKNVGSYYKIMAYVGGDVYEQVYANSTRKVKRLPANRTVESLMEVIQLNKAKNFRDLRSNYQQTVKHFDKGHSYPSGSNYLSNGRQVKLGTVGNKKRAVKLTVFNNNPNELYDNRKEAMSAERVVGTIVKDVKEYLDREVTYGKSNIFSILSGNAIVINTKKLNPNFNSISDLYYLNAAILEKSNPTVFKKMLDLANTIDGLNDPKHTNLRKVAEVLADNVQFKGKAQIKAIDGARSNVINTLAGILGATQPVSGVTFGDTIEDFRKAISGSLSEGKNNMLNANLQKSARTDRINNDVAQHIVSQLSKQFGVPAEIISEDKAYELIGYNTANGFFLNGTAYYVEGRIRKDTPIHEMLHPFIEVLDNVNPVLYNSLISELQSSEAGRRVMAEVNRLYPERTDRDRKKEALVQLMGESIANIISPSKNKGLIAKLKEFWNFIGRTLRNMFGRNIIPYKLSPNLTISDLVNMIARGDKVMLGAISGSALELQKDRDLISSDLVDHLLIPNERKGKKIGYEQEMLDNRIAFIQNDIEISPSKSYTVYTPMGAITYDFKKEFDEGPAAVREKIITKVLPNIETNDQKRKEQLLEWINGEDMGASDPETQKKYFGIKDTKRRMFTPAVITEFKRVLNHTPALAMVPYSKLNDRYQNTVFEGIADPTLLDRDPFVIIHRDVTEDGKSVMLEISILDIHFGASNLAGNKDRMILSNELTKQEHEEFDIKGSNNLDEVRKLQMATMAMKMKSVAGNKVIIRNIGIVNMKRDSLSIRMADTPRVITNISNFNKVPDFIARLNPVLQDLYTDESLHNVADYTPDYVSMLRNFLYEERAAITSYGRNVNKVSPGLEKNIDTINNYINGKGSENELIAMMEYRRNRLEHQLGINTTEKRNDSEEYWLLSEVLGNLKGFKRARNRVRPSPKDANYVEEFFASIHDVRNEAMQDFYRIMRNQTKFVTAQFRDDFREPFQEKIKALDKVIFERNPQLRLAEYAADIGHKRFEKMFKMKEYMGDDGNMHTINTFELHLDRSDPAAKDLSDEELDLANFIAKQVEKYMKDMYRHQFTISGEFHVYDDKTSERILEKKKLDEAVDAQYAKYWKKGMLPLMTKAPSQQFFEGNLGRAAQKFWKRMANPVEMFDEMLDLTQASGKDDEVRSYFANQYNGIQTVGLGSKHRATMLGLQPNNDADYEVSISDSFNGKKMNEDLNTNLEDVLDFFVMDVLWKSTMDNEVIPEYHGVQSRLNGMALMYSTSQEANERHVRTMFQKIVHGKHQLEHKSKEWEKVAAGLNIAYKLTTFNGVALSIPVAITSGIGNFTELNLHAFASQFADPYDTFNWTEVTRAQYLMVTNANLVEKLTHYYQITESERFDLLTNPRYKETSKHPWTGRAMHILNWMTDYSVRQLVMVAQMVHDGSWDAHSLDSDGNVTYNEIHDRRFFPAKGKSSPEQRKKRDWVRRNLVDDPRFQGDKAQDPDGALIRGYDVTDQAKFEWISSYFVTGTYNQESTGRYDSFILMKVVAQFKKYFISKAELRIGGKKTKAEGGFKHIVDHGNGNLEEVWVPIETEGVYVSLGKYFAKDVVPAIFQKKDLKKMSELQKYNAIRTFTDGAMFAAIYLLFTGLGKLDDDDREKKSTLAELRPIMAIKNGLMTALAITPGEIIRTLSIPAFEQLKRIYNLITFNGTSSDLRRSSPGMATIETFQDLNDYLN